MQHQQTKGEQLLAQMRQGAPLSLREQASLTFRLSVPAMLAQLSSVVMQYIDASMVGQIGATASAAIGLVTTSTWLFDGFAIAATVGFTVQVAQLLGANDEKKARDTMRQGLVLCLCFSVAILALCVGIHAELPRWLGGDAEICRPAAEYFLIFMLALPLVVLNSFAGGMLQSSGNMRLPSVLNVMTCVLDVVFNALFIFPTRTVTVLGAAFTLPGAGLGVAGAALGTSLAEAVISLVMAYNLLWRSPLLKLRKGEKTVFYAETIQKALKIALPVGFGNVVMSGAQVMATRIVAPLGNVSIAANAFAVTAESLCYMPGYGIGAAASTLIGQSIGARRQDMTRSLSWLTTGLGMAVMTGTGFLMYLAAPAMMGLLTPDAAIRELGVAVLRIEAFAEPLYAASIVAAGVFRGAGDTLIPSCMDFASMWLVRLPLAALLAPQLGLRGVWIAMCLELCVRGILFLLRLKDSRWMR